MGKSRLVSELAERGAAAGMTVLIGHCVNLPDGMLPYVPFVDAFRRLDSGTWRKLEPHLRGDGRSGEQFGQLQMYEAVVELLADLATENPVCLILEDLHWADRPSRDLILYLVNRLRDERVALMLTYRSDDVHRRHPLQPFLAEITRNPLVRRLSLDPLTPADIGLLLSSGPGAPLSAAAVRDIVERAEGNAFYAEELLEARRTVVQRDRLPSALADVLIARLDLLDIDAQRVVGVAAVAGRRVDHELLAAVTGLPEYALDEALRDAVARHILIPTDVGGYEFRHALLQEAAYSDLLPGERVRIHATYAELFNRLRATEPAKAAEAAYHAEHSHNLPLALSSAVHAASYARSVYAPTEALRHVERALQWWAAVPDAAELTGTTEVVLQLRAAEAASASGDSPRAVALLSSAVKCLDPADDPSQYALAQSRLAGELMYVGEDERAMAATTAASEVAEQLPTSAVRAEVLAMRGAVLFMTHDSDDGQAAAELARADAVAAGAIAAEASALNTLSRVAERSGDSDTAAAYLTRALELARSVKDIAAEIRTLFNLSMSRYDAGDLRGTLRWTELSMERAMASGTTWSTHAREARGIDILARYSVGDWDDTIHMVQVSTDRAPSTAKLIFQAMGLYPAVGRGLPGVEAQMAELQAARHPDRFEDFHIHMLLVGCRIDHQAWQAEPAAAVQTYLEGVDYPVPSRGQHYMGRIWLAALALSAEADIAVRAGQRGDDAAVSAARTAGEAMIDDARETAELAVPRGGRIGLEGTAWLARAEAEWSRLLGEHDVGIWETSLAAFDYGYDYEVARSRWRLAEVLIAAGRTEEAAAHLRSAHETAERLAAAPLLTALDRLARRSRIGGVAEERAVTLLTPREQEVLALLAHGNSNRQLGAALFISEKTASVHVSNIIGKLGAGSRGEAVAVARRRGLV